MEADDHRFPAVSIGGTDDFSDVRYRGSCHFGRQSVIVNENSSHSNGVHTFIHIEPLMKSAPNQIDQLFEEHRALMRHYGRAQVRCSDLMREQAAELMELRSQAVRLRAAVIVRETALAWEREDRLALRMLIPGLPRRLVLARRVDQLLERVHELMRERLHWQWGRPTDHASPSTKLGTESSDLVEATMMPTKEFEPVEDTAGFETSLAAADLVICQTGCLSHDAYWRVQDHCKRTGKACVVVAQPDAVRIVRIHQARSPEDAEKHLHPQ